MKKEVDFNIFKAQTNSSIWRIVTLVKNGRCLSQTGELSHNNLQ